MSETAKRVYRVDATKLPPRALKEGVQVSTAYLSLDPVVYVTLSEDRVDGRRARTNLAEHASADKPEALERERRVDFGEARGLYSEGKKALVRLRHRIKVGDHMWHVDQFEEGLDGLWLGWVELDSEHEDFLHPDWLHGEVTHDARYSDVALARDGRPAE